MPYLNYHSDSTDISRIDQKDEDIKALRQSVSVQMHVNSEDLTHPSGCGFGLSLFDMQEDPDTHINVGKKLRILAPTIEGSGTLLQVFLDGELLGTAPAPNLVRGVITLVEFRFWKDVDKYKVTYFIEGDLVATVEINRDVFTPNLRFRCGISLIGVCELKIYNITYAKKDVVARTIAVQGTGTITLPPDQTTIVTTAAGGIGRINKYSIGDSISTKVEYGSAIEGTIVPLLYLQLRDCIAVIDYDADGVNTDITTTRELAGKGIIIIESSSSRKNTIRFTDSLENPGISGINHGDLTKTPILGIQPLFGPAKFTLNGALLFTKGFSSNQVHYSTTYDGVNYDTITLPNALINFDKNEYGNDLLSWTLRDGGSVNNCARLLYCTELSDIKTIDIPHYIHNSEGDPSLIQTCYTGSGWFLYCRNKIYQPDLGTTVVTYEVWYCGDGETWSKTDYDGSHEYHPNFIFYVGGNLFLSNRLDGRGRLLVSTDNGNDFNYTVTTHQNSWCYGVFNDILYSQTAVGTGFLQILDNVGELLVEPPYNLVNVGINFVDDIILRPTTNTSVYRDADGNITGPVDALNNDRSDMFMFSRDFINWKTLDLMSAGAYIGKINNQYHFLSAINETQIASLLAITKINTTTVVSNNASGILGNKVEFDVDGNEFIFNGSRSDIPPPSSVIEIVTGNEPVINYNAPIGTSLKISYNDQAGTGTSIGKKISTECLGFDLVDKYDAGNSTFYYEIVEKNTLGCGYVADTLKSVVLVGKGSFEIPPGIIDLTVEGRGSSFINKTLNVASSIIPINIDEIRFNGLRPYFTDLMAIELFKGNYYVLFGRHPTPSGTPGGNFEQTVLFKGPTLNDLTFVTLSGGGFLYQVSDKLIHGLSITTDGEVWDDFAHLGSTWGDYKGKWQGYGDNYVKVEGFGGSYSKMYYTSNNFVTVKSKTLYSLTGNGNYPQARIGDKIIAFDTMSNGERARFCSDFNTSSSPSFNTAVTFRKYDDENVNLELMLGHTPSSIRVRDLVVGNGICAALYYRSGVVNPTDQAFTGLIATWDGSYETGDYTAYGKLYPVTGFVAPKLTFNGTYFIINDLNKFYYSTDILNWTYVSDVQDFGLKLFPVNTIEGETYYSTTGRDFNDNKQLIIKTVLPGEQYVLKLPEEGKNTTVTVNDDIHVLPGNRLSATPQSNVLHSKTLDVNKDTVIVYDVPVGGYLELKYLAIDDGVEVAGTLLGEFCDGFNLMERYANGVGGEYTQLIAENDILVCGYTAPVVKALLSFDTTVDIDEGDFSEIHYHMSKPLTTDIELTASWLFLETATSDDVGDISVSVGGSSYQVILEGGSFIITAGVTEFSIKIEISNDSIIEPDETFTITLTEVTSTGNLVGLPASTTVTILNINYVVENTYLSGSYVDYEEREIYGHWENNNREQIRAKVGPHGMIRTDKAYDQNKYYIPLTGVDLDKTIVGICTSGAVLADGESDRFYPGMNDQSWGMDTTYFYHDGISTPLPTPIPNDGSGGILLDLDNKTINYVIGGVTQSLITNPLPSGDIYLVVGSSRAVGSTTFYLDLMGETQTNYTPPAGFVKGFGNLVRSNVYTPLVIASDDILIPSSFISTFAEDRLGLIRVDAMQGARTTHSVNSGAWLIEFNAAEKSNLRIGICNANHVLSCASDAETASIQLGVNEDSYGISFEADNSFTYHNGIVTPITNQNDITTFRLILDMATRTISAKFDYQTKVLFTNIPQDDYYIAVTTTTPRVGNLGDTILVNAGRFNHGSDIDDSVIPGYGPLINGFPNEKIISTYCEDQDLVGNYSDGVGGTYTDPLMTYSENCGYMHPDEAVSGWSLNKLPPNIAINADGTIFHRIKEGYAVSVVGHTTGKHYFEVTNTDSNIYVGLCPAEFNNIGEYLMYASGSIAVDLSGDTAGRVNQNGDTIDYSFVDEYDDYLLGATVGFMLDYDAGTLSIKYANGDFRAVTDLVLGTEKLFVNIGVYEHSSPEWPATNIEVNLGQKPFTIGMPAGYNAWGEASADPLSYSLDSGATSMDEGTSLTQSYTLTSNTHDEVTFQFTVAYDTADNNDIVGFSLSKDNGSTWDDLEHYDTFTIPNGIDNFLIRTTSLDDSTTEGDESFTINVEEITAVKVLTNTTPVAVTITILDTSLDYIPPVYPVLECDPTMDIDEGVSSIHTFTVSELYHSDITLQFIVDNTNAPSNPDITYEYNVGEFGTWTAITSSENFIIEDLNNVVLIRINVPTNSVVSSGESITITLNEVTTPLVLFNVTPASVVVTINNTTPEGSIDPALYLDDYVNNNKSFTGSNITDYFDYVAVEENGIVNPTVNYTPSNQYLEVLIPIEGGLSGYEEIYRPNNMELFPKAPVYLDTYKFTLEYTTSNTLIDSYDHDPTILPPGGTLPPDYFYKEDSIQIPIHTSDPAVNSLLIIISSQDESTDELESYVTIVSGRKTRPISSNFNPKIVNYLLISKASAGDFKIEVEIGKNATNKTIKLIINDVTVVDVDIPTTIFTKDVVSCPGLNLKGTLTSSFRLKKYRLDSL